MKALLVEDSPADVRIVQIAIAEIQGMDLQLDVASTLDEAEALVTDNISPDVVLLDLNLPDSSGLQTVKRMQQMLPRTPVIVLTGLADEDLGIASMKAGAQDFLVKGQMFGKLLARSMYHAIERNRILLELQDTLAELQPTP